MVSLLPGERVQDLVEEPKHFSRRSAVVEVDQHLYSLHEEIPIEVCWHGHSLLIELEEPLLGHVHCLEDSYWVELESLPKCDLDHWVEEPWICKEWLDGGNQSVWVKVDMMSLHLFEKCAKDFAIAWDIVPLNSLGSDYSFDMTNPGCNYLEKDLTSPANVLGPFLIWSILCIDN